MNYDIPISKEKYTLAALKVINCFLDLTTYELEIVSKMLDNNIQVLDTKGRMIIRRLTGKNTATTNNYIKRLKDKKVLIPTEKGLKLNHNITNPISDKEINIKFNVN